MKAVDSICETIRPILGKTYPKETIVQRKSISEFRNPIEYLPIIQQTLNGKLGDERRKVRLCLPRAESVDLPSTMIKKLFKISHRPAKQAAHAFNSAYFREFDGETDFASHCLSLENLFVTSRLPLQLRIVVMWRLALLCLNEDISIRSFWIEIAHHALCIIIESVQNQLRQQERMIEEARVIAQLEKENMESQKALHPDESNLPSGIDQVLTPVVALSPLVPSKSMLLESLLHSLRLCEDTISQMEIENIGRHYNKPLVQIYNFLPI
jgi:hypothetical protein